MPIARRAYAKVNLALSVGPPLPPGDPNAGLHPIASWIHAIDLFDTVEVARLDAEPSRLEIRWAPDAPRPSPIDWPAEKDLASRAHRLLERETGRALPALIRITKRIPVGGGLGGGSSDAAATFLATNDLFGLGLGIPRLAWLSRELGSDIAYFLDEQNPPRPAIVGHLGELIERVPPARGVLVLIIPPFGCPTGPVYRAFDSRPGPGLREAAVRALAASGRVDGDLFNDLTPAAESVQPALASLGRAIAAAVCPVHMSGSGSTLFVPAPDPGSADAISAKIRAVVPDVSTIAVRAL
jgi:4-diphosphocytidyl-2-C-methyl-D-erythritol kinase